MMREGALPEGLDSNGARRAPDTGASSAWPKGRARYSGQYTGEIFNPVNICCDTIKLLPGP